MESQTKAPETNPFAQLLLALEGDDVQGLYKEERQVYTRVHDHLAVSRAIAQSIFSVAHPSAEEIFGVYDRIDEWREQG